MAESIREQVLAFLWMVAAGSLIGFLFDFYRVLRGRLRPGPRGTFLGDLSFWLLSTVLVFAFMLRSNFGDFRLYVLLGVLAGAYLYHLLLSHVVIRLWVAIWRAVGRVNGIAGGVLIATVRVVYLGWRRSWLRKSVTAAYRRCRQWAASERVTRPPEPPGGSDQA